ncbi:MAG: DNA adenine methylase [Bacteroidetes bacterium]|nr:DNA adenine methylase [Bacteroidota bacterium]
MNEPIKTPISYYGGKQQMLRHILPLIPNHIVYCEPFCGGAAVYWSKSPSKVEVINDMNDELINFYIVLKTRFKSLQQAVKITLHSRKIHKQAWEVYQHPELNDQITRAWALWVLSTQSFGSQLSGSWGFDKSKSSIARKVMNKKRQFTELLQERIELTQIECRDALDVIRLYDTPDTFHYVDPPYPNTNCGHYKGYTMKNLEELLIKLTTIKGRFLLSNYPQEIISKFAGKYGWHQLEYKMPLCASKKAVRSSKIEVLTANYPIKKGKPG